MKERRMYYKPGGYDTDHLIDDLTDFQLLGHMGVPLRFTSSHATKMVVFPEAVDLWMENLPYIFRPSIENREKGMCGTGLILYGAPGTYKTTTAAAILLRVIRKKIKNTDPTGRNFTWHGAAMGRYLDWQDTSDLFRSANSDEIADAYADEIRTAITPSGPMNMRADFLVLDDISRERPTEYNTTELQRILRHRADAGFPTILTTNTQPEDWSKAHGESLAGYLHRSFIAVEFK